VERFDEASALDAKSAHALTYELIREHRMLLLDLVDAERKILGLRIEALRQSVDHIALALQLQHANLELSKLRSGLQDLKQRGGQADGDLPHALPAGAESPPRETPD
jgi:hypothetical protein